MPSVTVTAHGGTDRPQYLQIQIVLIMLSSSIIDVQDTGYPAGSASNTSACPNGGDTFTAASSQALLSGKHEPFLSRDCRLHDSHDDDSIWIPPPNWT